jgi:hypothetical protein
MQVSAGLCVPLTRLRTIHDEILKVICIVAEVTVYVDIISLDSVIYESTAAGGSLPPRIDLRRRRSLRAPIEKMNFFYEQGIRRAGGSSMIKA